MLVHNLVIDEQRVLELLDKVQEKKELQAVDRSFIRDQLFTFLKTERKAALYLAKKKISPRAEEYKQIVKKIRAKLRRFHGLFQEKQELRKREELFKKLKKSKEYKELRELSQELLQTHASSKERSSFYEQLYKDIFKHTGKPEKILDLGAGMHPLSLIHSKLLIKSRKTPLHYFAFDINKEEAKQLNIFFRKVQECYPFFKGKAKIFDLLQWEKIEHMHQADLCFLLKVTDVLDQNKGHKRTELVLKHLPAKHVILSFPTRTVSGKTMVAPRRKWVELLCKRLNYNYKIIKKSNEIFYLITKE